MKKFTGISYQPSNNWCTLFDKNGIKKFSRARGWKSTIKYDIEKLKSSADHHMWGVKEHNSYLKSGYNSKRAKIENNFNQCKWKCIEDKNCAGVTFHKSNRTCYYKTKDGT